ncbi:DUF692 family multinuclear iron-containing protein [Polyangium sp. y55x31]|uniref:multinuclear nonheme iron-dependent oxidase n=1 Tax=Polyangium sp. y55x31 TaxID=3042688 RepID=UPI002482B8D9|nr:DUF692 family multinuclear iron-containing protein [Polyangium sp. y55x31]MDI1476420.1 DUF692 family protein [Polyangium sp. y55x31]
MNQRPPRVGLNIMVDDAYRAAAAPLFAEGLVDAVEWNVDQRWLYGDSARKLPRWIDRLLDLYASADCLYGHGVWFSVLSARWEPRQDRWLSNLARECRRRRYRHISEHFGFLTAGAFAEGTLLPVPKTEASIRIGADRLARLADAAGGAAGLENLAAALGPDDADAQGGFLDAILAEAGGFLLLDLHNLYTLGVNMGRDPADLLSTYPLERVREIHVSGGSFYRTRAAPEKGPFRLDSHDGPLPPEVLALLPRALARCPNVEVVFFERRGDTFASKDDFTRYRDDFRAVRRAVEDAHG